MREISGYIGYDIDGLGRIYSWKHRQYLKNLKTNTGYLQVALYAKREKKWFLVHRLVAQTFIPNPNNYPIINHKNGDKTDNKISNLEWCTYQQNTLAAIRLGKNKPGGRKPLITKDI